MEENKLLYWAQKYWFSVVIALGVMIVGIVGGDLLFGSKKGRAKEDLFRIKTLFSSLEKGEPLSQESLVCAEKILLQHPEIKPLYEGKMSLVYLEQKNVLKGVKSIENVQARTKKLVSPYLTDFTASTLLLEQGHHDQALLQSKKLEEHLQAEAGFAHLRCFNLLRLCFLSKKLGHIEEMRSSWKTLTSLPEYSALSATFSEGSFHLESLFQ